MAVKAKTFAYEIALDREGLASAEDAAPRFVELEVRIDLELDPVPEDLHALLERAEWGCFVGASLTPKPTYSWRVNGNDAR